MPRKNNKAKHPRKYKKLNSEKLLKELQNQLSSANKISDYLEKATKKDRD